MFRCRACYDTGHFTRNFLSTSQKSFCKGTWWNGAQVQHYVVVLDDVLEVACAEPKEEKVIPSQENIVTQVLEGTKHKQEGDTSQLGKIPWDLAIVPPRTKVLH